MFVQHFFFLDCTAHLVDDRRGVLRQCIAAPCNVTIGTDQNQVALVNGPYVGFGDFNSGNRQSGPLGCFSDPSGIDAREI